jgi:endoglucanase
MRRLVQVLIGAVLFLTVSVGTGSGAKPGKPTNVSPPTISGEAVVGGTLTTLNGSWSGKEPMTFTYQWQRCNASGGRCSSISGATAATYRLAAADEGRTVRSAVTARNSAGATTAYSAPSAVVARTADVAPPTAPSAPSVSNVTQTSLTLSWGASGDNVGVAGYRAYRDGSAVGTTTSLTFTHGSLSCGTSYALAVEAFDAAGNVSPRATVEGATAACTPGGDGGGAASGLHVQGNRLVDGAGRQIVLHGVNRSGTEYACQDNWGFSDGSIEGPALQKIADWRASAVRVLLNERCWNVDLADNRWDGDAYRREIAAYVNRLTSLGLVPVVSLMWSAPGTAKAYNAPMPNRDNSPRFWTSVANTFKGNSSVIFDLLNEPHPDGNRNTAEAWRCWKHGGTCAGFSFAAAGMQELVDAVRATGATNVISIPGVQYANNLTGWLANRPHDPLGNLVASWHVYQFNGCNSVSCYESQIAPVIAQVPVIVNEIGAECTTGTGWASTVMTWLDARTTGYNAWTWNAWGECKHSLITNYDTGAPTPWGAWYRDHLATLPAPVRGPDTTPPTVTADPRGGVFGPGLAVRLTADEPATIYYTLDGSVPTAASAVYGGALTLDSSTTLRFVGVDAAGNTSAVATEVYTVDTSLPALAIEAEQMVLLGGFGGPISSATASGGRVLYIWNTDTATLQLTTPAASRIVVHAYGSDCFGPPNMVVAVDGSVVLDADVPSATTAPYQAPVTLAAGTHTISVAYTNERASSSCNRNLWVDRIDLHD